MVKNMSQMKILEIAQKIGTLLCAAVNVQEMCCVGVVGTHKITLTLSLLMLHICGVSKTFGEWYQKTNKTEDTNKLTSK
jgi:hypothetical protein